VVLLLVALLLLRLAVRRLRLVGGLLCLLAVGRFRRVAGSRARLLVRLLSG
jgi:hypothetical protein